MVIYPPEILRLLTPEGFNQAFEEAMKRHNTQLDAYLEVAARHEKYFGRERYQDFVSFRMARYKMLNKKRK
jgi:hypothetical protein